MTEQTTETARDPKAAEQFLAEGRKAEKKMDRWTAIEQFSQAHAADPQNAEVCFRLAYHLDLVGEEDKARELYESACLHGPEGKSHLNGLINLAVAYEDHGLYAKAERCLKLVIETEPNHARARLFMKDVQASRQATVIDDSLSTTYARGGVLDTPVTDFDLSEQARDMLRKLHVRTLGDLIRVSESELLAYRGLGEDAVHEIRSLLSRKGLRFGQGLDNQRNAARQQVYEQLGGGDVNLDSINKSVDELELSVRARKALDLLNIGTIGDLVARTEDELLGIKNFGSTSLDEIKAKLEEMGLGLRKLEEE
ncbi:MAG: hypothetical protein GC159_16615 [Phycisphaera sp.]|nr:hypothetical protein [Phycisphaera sp.]